MGEIVLEQALFRREHERPPALAARSPGFADAWVADCEQLMAGFGERTGGVACPLALFAQPLGNRHVAIVRAADTAADASGWPVLAFHFLLVDRTAYERYLGDPFSVAERALVNWRDQGALPTLTWPEQPLPRRTVSQVQAVLKRIKANALREDEDPEADLERNVDNSLSPALLGGAQVLVDGGKLVFIRRGPDQPLVQGLWTLLPDSLRSKIWPATFAFDNALDFDIIVVPRLGDGPWEGCTTEEQAADYPDGSYELALQTAAEAGDQAGLDQVFRRRTSNETLRLAWRVLVAMAVIVLGSQLFLSGPPPRLFPPTTQARMAAGMVAAGAGGSWSALGFYQMGKHLAKIDRDHQP